MPLLGFMSRFEKAVENGFAEANGLPLPHPGIRPKRQTIRKRRKDGRDPKPGQMLYGWVKVRTPQRRKLGEAKCKSAWPIRFYHPRNRKNQIAVRLPTWVIVLLAADNRRRAWEQNMAIADGFANVGELLDLIEKMHGLPFDGLLIRW